MIIIVKHRESVKAYRLRLCVRDRMKLESGNIVLDWTKVTGADYDEITLDAVKEARQAGELILPISTKTGSAALPGFEDDKGSRTL